MKFFRYSAQFDKVGKWEGDDDSDILSYVMLIVTVDNKSCMHVCSTTISNEC
jgi:hypothetical protein